MWIKYKAEFIKLIDEHLDIVNISINSQFVRTVMTENVSYVNDFFCIFVFVNL